MDKSTRAKFIVPAQWNGSSAEIWRLYGEGWGGAESSSDWGFLVKGRNRGDLHSSEFIYKIRPRIAFMVPQSAILVWTLYGDKAAFDWPGFDQDLREAKQ